MNWNSKSEPAKFESHMSAVWKESFQCELLIFKPCSYVQNVLSCCNSNFSEPISCPEPIEVVSYKIGVCKVSAQGKDCHTDFHRLSYNGKTSVVLCRPHTGRMHQIRVHLQYLGYPIINDPLYNHPVFGPEKGKGGNIGKTNDQLIKDLITLHNAENWLGIDDTALGAKDGSLVPLAPIPSASSLQKGALKSQRNLPSNENAERPEETTPIQTKVPDSPRCDTSISCEKIGSNVTDNEQLSGIEDSQTTTSASSNQQEVELEKFDASKLSVDEHCQECKVKYKDPKPKDLVMFLHAYTYSVS